MSSTIALLGISFMLVIITIHRCHSWKGLVIVFLCGVWKKMAPKGVAIGRYGFAGVGMALLEELCHCGGGL